MNKKVDAMTLYTLLEVIHVSDEKEWHKVFVIRVPQGWIYTTVNRISSSSVFVPEQKKSVIEEEQREVDIKDYERLKMKLNK